MSNTPDLPDGFIPAEQPDPAEMNIGPFYKHKVDAITLMWPEHRHTNMQGVIHGGVLMTFADFTLASTAMRVDASFVTLNMSCNFVGNCGTGDWLRGEAVVTQRSRNLVFLNGTISQGTSPLLTFSGIGKRVREDT